MVGKIGSGSPLTPSSDDSSEEDFEDQKTAIQNAITQWGTQSDHPLAPEFARTLNITIHDSTSLSEIKNIIKEAEANATFVKIDQKQEFQDQLKTAGIGEATDQGFHIDSAATEESEVPVSAPPSKPSIFSFAAMGSAQTVTQSEITTWQASISTYVSTTWANDYHQYLPEVMRSFPPFLEAALQQAFANAGGNGGNSVTQSMFMSQLNGFLNNPGTLGTGWLSNCGNYPFDNHDLWVNTFPPQIPMGQQYGDGPTNSLQFRFPFLNPQKDLTSIFNAIGLSTDGLSLSDGAGSSPLQDALAKMTNYVASPLFLQAFPDSDTSRQALIALIGSQFSISFYYGNTQDPGGFYSRIIGDIHQFAISDQFNSTGDSDPFPSINPNFLAPAILGPLAAICGVGANDPMEETLSIPEYENPFGQLLTEHWTLQGNYPAIAASKNVYNWLSSFQPFPSNDSPQMQWALQMGEIIQTCPSGDYDDVRAYCVNGLQKLIDDSGDLYLNYLGMVSNGDFQSLYNSMLDGLTGQPSLVLPPPTPFDTLYIAAYKLKESNSTPLATDLWNQVTLPGATVASVQAWAQTVVEGKSSASNDYVNDLVNDPTTAALFCSTTGVTDPLIAQQQAIENWAASLPPAAAGFANLISRYAAQCQSSADLQNISSYFTTNSQGMDVFMQFPGLLSSSGQINALSTFPKGILIPEPSSYVPTQTDIIYSEISTMPSSSDNQAIQALKTELIMYGSNALSSHQSDIQSWAQGIINANQGSYTTPNEAYITFTYSTDSFEMRNIFASFTGASDPVASIGVWSTHDTNLPPQFVTALNALLQNLSPNTQANVQKTVSDFLATVVNGKDIYAQYPGLYSDDKNGNPINYLQPLQSILGITPPSPAEAPISAILMPIVNALIAWEQTNATKPQLDFSKAILQLIASDPTMSLTDLVNKIEGLFSETPPEILFPGLNQEDITSLCSAVGIPTLTIPNAFVSLSDIGVAFLHLTGNPALLALFDQPGMSNLTVAQATPALNTFAATLSAAEKSALQLCCRSFGIVLS